MAGTRDWAGDCAAVIPCFNESARIAGVVSGVRQCLPAVIVVDDGSTDLTAERARRAGAEVIRCDANRGKGAALRRGWRRARERGFAWVAMLDGDGQHAPGELSRFFEHAERTGARLVVGNRMDQPGRMPLVRRWVNRWMSRRLSRLTGTLLPDSQCGYRLAHLETLLALPLRANRFEIESAMLVAFLTAGQKVAFVPVSSRYEHPASKINPLTDTWRWWRWWRTQTAVAADWR